MGSSPSRLASLTPAFSWESVTSCHWATFLSPSLHITIIIIIHYIFMPAPHHHQAAARTFSLNKSYGQPSSSPPLTTTTHISLSLGREFGEERESQNFFLPW